MEPGPSGKLMSLTMELQAELRRARPQGPGTGILIVATDGWTGESGLFDGTHGWQDLSNESRSSWQDRRGKW